MDSKPFWESKTFWFNLLALAVAIATAFGYDRFKPSPDVERIALGIVAVANILLRFLTNKGIHVRRP